MMKNYRVYNATSHQFPIVIDLPHSGTFVTESMTNQLLPTAVLANTDWFLRELYDFLPQMGLTVIENNLSRYVIDPNRDSKAEVSGNYYHLIYEQNTFGHQLYQTPLTSQEINHRIVHFYQPYHQQLQQLLADKLAVFDQVLLIDLHSFAEYTHPSVGKTADVVLGNNWGQTSSSALFCYFQTLFQSQSYRVDNNFPFRGGYITRYYGDQPGIQALQIELRYNQYIQKRYFGEEMIDSWEPSVFNDAKQRLEFIFQKLAADLITKRLRLT
ncbi:N-formylglutamate amidohydrolase [Lentilactobacillus fungorum]|nr:N-formylglutamate amidohydrolase [Lentilactobacillus fungorum]